MGRPAHLGIADPEFEFLHYKIEFGTFKFAIFAQRRPTMDGGRRRPSLGSGHKVGSLAL